MRDSFLALGAAMALLPAVGAGPRNGRGNEAAFDRFKESIVTVEVLPLAGEAKSVLGSGYAVAPGRIMTNYHVVGSYIQHCASWVARRA